jgi:iron complex outermembrane receptor protein
VNEVLTGSLSFKVADEDAYLKNVGSRTNKPGKIEKSFFQTRLTYAPNADFELNATAYRLDMDAPGFFDQQYLPVDVALHNQSYNNLNNNQLAQEWDVFEDAPKHT